MTTTLLIAIFALGEEILIRMLTLKVISIRTQGRKITLVISAAQNLHWSRICGSISNINMSEKTIDTSVKNAILKLILLSLCGFIKINAQNYENLNRFLSRMRYFYRWMQLILRFPSSDISDRSFLLLIFRLICHFLLT